MGPEIDHDLDFEGDVLLVLQNPNEPFAVWDKREDWELSRPKPPGTESLGIQYYKSEDPAWKANFLCLNESMPETQDTPDTQTMPETQETPERGEPQQKKLKSNHESVAVAGTEVRFRLSSRHLILASPYFRAMLTGPWEENCSRTGSMYTTTASDWDEEALTILMDIIHGHSEKIPRSISLELLAKIAVLVDYYKCHKIVKFYSDTWIKGSTGLEGTTVLPRKHSRDLVLWLFTSWVFAQQETFHILTLVAAKTCRGPLRTLGLPFPNGFIGS